MRQRLRSRHRERNDNPSLAMMFTTSLRMRRLFVKRRVPLYEDVYACLDNRPEAI